MRLIPGHTAHAVMGLLLMIGSLSACTTNPFGPTTDTVSSTSDHAWWNQDGQIRAEHKALAFLTMAGDNVVQDAARGQGEYLTALGTLLGVTADRQPAFQASAQQHFLQWLDRDQAARLTQLREWAR